MNVTYLLPLQLGIHGTYKGYYYLVTLLEIALENPENIILFSKLAFPMVAQKFSTKPYCVERDIRTVIKQCWNSPYRKNLQDISPYELRQQPTVGEFIDILYWHIKSME